METSEILYGAADHIAAFGHCKNRLWGEGDRQTAPVCAVGGMLVVAGVEAFVPAHTALTRYLNGPNVPTWNNAPERTAAEVVEALRACAVIEAAKEQAALIAAAKETAPSQVARVGGLGL